MIVSKNDKIFNAGYSIELLQDNVIYLIFDGTVQIGIERAKNIRDTVMELVSSNKFSTIVDFRGVSGVTNLEAREFMANCEHFNFQKTCDAFLTDSFSTNMLISTYIKIFKPKIPTEIFDNFDEALAWVKSF